MRIEFLSSDKKYPDKQFNQGTEIKNVKIYTPDLPIGFNTIPFQPFRMKKDLEWAILVDILIPRDEDFNVTLKGQVNPPSSASLNTYRYLGKGLRVVLIENTNEYRGLIFPKK